MLSEKQISRQIRVEVVEEDIIKAIYSIDEGIKEVQIQQAEYLTSQVTKILNANGDKKFKLLIDMVRLAKVKPLTSKARVIYAELSKDERLSCIAVVGVSTLLRTIASLILKASRRKTDMKIASTTIEAMGWLKHHR